MGIAAYNFKRPNGDYIRIFVPKSANPITVGYGERTISDFLADTDFPIEAHVFVNNAEKEAQARAFGFGHVINTSLYSGEKWVLDNGAYVTIGAGNYCSVTDAYGSLKVSGYGGSNNIWWMPWILDDNRMGLSTPTVEFTDTPYRVYIYSPGVFPKFTYDKDTFYINATPIYITSDPYGDGGETEPGGGIGDFDNTGDDIGIPDLPATSASDAGFITLFNPSAEELRNLASYMWSDLFDVNGWKKVFADPMQAILGLSIVPVNVPASTAKLVKVGNISTDVSMTVAASQYVTVDCGTLNVNEFWGAYLDYDPYTKAEIYLPYIGIHALSTDDIMGKSVHVVYHVDILSGSCCAHVKCGNSVLYSFVGQCSSSVPITGDNWTNVINGALSIAGSIGSMVATGGASAPSAIGNIASTAVNSMKPSIEKSGSMGGTGGMLGIQTPYLILTRPRQAVPRDQNKYIGYPSFITAKLSDLNGYTEIDSIHLENVGATEKELSEIENILKSGVIF